MSQTLLAGTVVAASSLLFLASPDVAAQAVSPGMTPPAPAAPTAVPAPVVAPGPQADASREQDELFAQLRDAARKNDADKAAALAARLPDYAIPSYVDYYRLKPRLRDASNEEILDFLKRYEGSAIADRLRNDWLLELGRKRDWFNFDRELPLFVKNDDYQVKCYALLSRASRRPGAAGPADRCW